MIWFSSQSIPEEGFFLDGDLICQTFGGKREELLNVRDMRLLGVHNYENVMAAMAIASSFGVPMEEIIPAVKAFRAVEHRIEFVAEKKGVVYYKRLQRHQSGCRHPAGSGPCVGPRSS